MPDKKPLFQKKCISAEKAALFFLMVVILIVIVVDFLLVLLVGAFSKHYGWHDTYVSLFLSFCIQIVFLVAVILVLRKRRLLYESNRYKNIGNRLAANCAHSLVAALLSVICIFCLAGLAIYFSYFLDKLGYEGTWSYSYTFSPFQRTLFFILVVIIAPICEELVFRGVFLSGLRNGGFKTITCILLSGVAFSLMHMNPSQTVFQFFIGCACAALVIKSKSIIPAIALHMSNNAIAYLIEFHSFELPDRFFLFCFSSKTNSIILPIVLAISGICSIYCLSRFSHAITKQFSLLNESDEGVDVLTSARESVNHSSLQNSLDSQSLNAEAAQRMESFNEEGNEVLEDRSEKKGHKFWLLFCLAAAACLLVWFFIFFKY